MPIFLSIMLIAISLGNLFSSILVFLLYIARMMGLMIVATLLLSISASRVRKLEVFSKYVVADICGTHPFITPLYNAENIYRG